MDNLAQLSREELLKAQEDVQSSIEALRQQIMPGERIASRPLLARLTAISEEIANRLTELDAHHA